MQIQKIFIFVWIPHLNVRTYVEVLSTPISKLPSTGFKLRKNDSQETLVVQRKRKSYKIGIFNTTLRDNLKISRVLK